MRIASSILTFYVKLLTFDFLAVQDKKNLLCAHLPSHPRAAAFIAASSFHNLQLTLFSPSSGEPFDICRTTFHSVYFHAARSPLVLPHTPAESNAVPNSYIDTTNMLGQQVP